MIWKKAYWGTKKQYTPIDSVLLFEDEKGPIAAKTYTVEELHGVPHTHTSQDITHSENQGNPKCVWCLRLY